MRRYLLPLALALLPLLLLACAQVRELQGGEKDTKAPVLLAAEPPNGTVHFAADRIVLRFDERVKLDRVRDRLLISPPLDKAPEVGIAGGANVVIALRAPLSPNTTYTFNIGEAVADITEGNPAAGLTYVISTGDVLDSAEVHGRVIDAFTDGPEAAVLVVLHTDTDSTGFVDGRPAYFTRTDASGAYAVRNMREGRYRLHALQDQNANFRNDLPNERVAFLEEGINTVDSSSRSLRMFLPLASTQHVKEATVLADRAWRLSLSRPADSLALTSIDRSGGSLSWAQERNPSNDTILFWPSDTTLLSGQRFTLSDGSGVIDTITYRPTRKMPFNLDIRAAGRTSEGVHLVRGSRPVARIRPELALLRIDSTETPADLVGNADGLLFSVMNAPKDGRSSTLVLLPGAFKDIYGGENDTLRLSLGTGQSAQSGDLRVDLSTDSGALLSGPLFLQLLTAQGGVLRTVPVPALPFRAELPGVPAGVHTLKLVEDLDGDGRWSTGSLASNRQPERVFRPEGEVTVRAGWEVVLDWSVKPR